MGWRIAAVAALGMVLGLTGWYIPANGIGPGATLGEQDAYILGQKVIADLPDSDSERVYLVPPGVPAFGRAPCSLLSLKWGSYYCVTTDEAVLSTGSVNKVRLAGGTPGVWLLVGHELGHSQQPLSSLLTTASLPRERNADCLGGAYVAEHLGYDARVRDSVSAAALVTGGDDPSDWDFHGTGEQRRDAALLGFDNGAAACPTV